MKIEVISFGYKHGPPPNANFVFDVRHLYNPYHDPKLRDMCGLDQPVSSAVLFGHDARGYAVCEGIASAVQQLKHGISLVRVAVGCTGGHHRSVAVAEELAGALRDKGSDATATHRDLKR